MSTTKNPELGHIRVVRILNKTDYPFHLETEKNLVFHDTLVKMSFDKKLFGFIDTDLTWQVALKDELLLKTDGADTDKMIKDKISETCRDGKCDIM